MVTLESLRHHYWEDSDIPEQIQQTGAWASMVRDRQIGGIPTVTAKDSLASFTRPDGSNPFFRWRNREEWMENRLAHRITLPHLIDSPEQKRIDRNLFKIVASMGKLMADPVRLRAVISEVRYYLRTHVANTNAPFECTAGKLIPEAGLQQTISSTWSALAICMSLVRTAWADGQFRATVFDDLSHLFDQMLAHTDPRWIDEGVIDLLEEALSLRPVMPWKRMQGSDTTASGEDGVLLRLLEHGVDFNVYQGKKRDPPLLYTIFLIDERKLGREQMLRAEEAMALHLNEVNHDNMAFFAPLYRNPLSRNYDVAMLLYYGADPAWNSSMLLAAALVSCDLDTVLLLAAYGASVYNEKGLPNAMVDVRGDEHQPANKHTVFTAMCMLVTTNCPMLLYKIIYWTVMQADALPWLVNKERAKYEILNAQNALRESPLLLLVRRKHEFAVRLLLHDRELSSYLILNHFIHLPPSVPGTMIDYLVWPPSKDGQPRPYPTKFTPEGLRKAMPHMCSAQVRTILSPLVDTYRPVYAAIATKQFGLMEVLVRAGCEVNSKEVGLYALHSSCKLDVLEIMLTVRMGPPLFDIDISARNPETNEKHPHKVNMRVDVVHLVLTGAPLETARFVLEWIDNRDDLLRRPQAGLFLSALFQANLKMDSPDVAHRINLLLRTVLRSPENRKGAVHLAPAPEVPLNYSRVQISTLAPLIVTFIEDVLARLSPTIAIYLWRMIQFIESYYPGVFQLAAMHKKQSLLYMLCNRLRDADAFFFQEGAPGIAYYHKIGQLADRDWVQREIASLRSALTEARTQAIENAMRRAKNDVTRPLPTVDQGSASSSSSSSSNRLASAASPTNEQERAIRLAHDELEDTLTEKMEEHTAYLEKRLALVEQTEGLFSEGPYIGDLLPGLARDGNIMTIVGLIGERLVQKDEFTAELRQTCLGNLLQKTDRRGKWGQRVVEAIAQCEDLHFQIPIKSSDIAAALLLSATGGRPAAPDVSMQQTIELSPLGPLLEHVDISGSGDGTHDVMLPLVHVAVLRNTQEMTLILLALLEKGLDPNEMSSALKRTPMELTVNGTVWAILQTYGGSVTYCSPEFWKMLDKYPHLRKQLSSSSNKSALVRSAHLKGLDEVARPRTRRPPASYIDAPTHGSKAYRRLAKRLRYYGDNPELRRKLSVPRTEAQFSEQQAKLAPEHQVSPEVRKMGRIAAALLTTEAADPDSLPADYEVVPRRTKLDTYLEYEELKQNPPPPGTMRPISYYMPRLNGNASSAPAPVLGEAPSFVVNEADPADATTLIVQQEEDQSYANV